MDVHITQFNVQLYFRTPVLDTDKLDEAFSQSDGFSAPSAASGDRSGSNTNHPMQNAVSFFRQGFRIAPVQSNALPFRILQVMSYPNILKEPESETLACLDFVTSSLGDRLGISVQEQLYAVRVVYHSIVTGSQEVQRMLSRLTRIDKIPSLAGKYVGHKNPMDALQLTSRTGGELVHDSWSDMRISQFDTNSYVVTIFNETGSLAGAIEFIRNVKQFVAAMMGEMESASLAEPAP
ncbi:MAG TPA: hypothetical protein VJP79_01280 [Nitrososphaera sp.]|nr:hypothetical protein [Nitrososphaera sp.]